MVVVMRARGRAHYPRRVSGPFFSLRSAGLVFLLALQVDRSDPLPSMAFGLEEGGSEQIVNYRLLTKWIIPFDPVDAFDPQITAAVTWTCQRYPQARPPYPRFRLHSFPEERFSTDHGMSLAEILQYSQFLRQKITPPPPPEPKQLATKMAEAHAFHSKLQTLSPALNGTTTPSSSPISATTTSGSLLRTIRAPLLRSPSSPFSLIL